MRPSIFLLAPLLTLTNAQATADGLIVPFISVLPACALKCYKLYDVQGACTPPNIASVSSTCFCGDPRLTPFLNSGTAGVQSVCGADSCQDTASLEKIQSWYQGYCNVKVSNPTTTSGSSGATGTSSGSSSSSKPQTAVNQTWFQGHWKWVVMLIVLIIAIVGGWLIAACLRRRYLRKKEREIEMRPPVAWGPHQMQASTNGYNYGDGVVDAGRAKEAKMMVGSATPADINGKRESKGWLRKERR